MKCFDEVTYLLSYAIRCRTLHQATAHNRGHGLDASFENGKHFLHSNTLTMQMQRAAARRRYDGYKIKKGLIKVINPFVELRGVEPLSKHILQKLSTCLFSYCLSAMYRKETNQYIT